MGTKLPLTQRPTRDVPESQHLKLTTEEVAAQSETLGKCINPATGEPVSARKDDTAVFPVKGSATGSPDGNGKGTCPECGAHVRLSGKGYITSHSVRSTPVPAPDKTVRLAERAPEVTDAGSRVGSPDASMRTRRAELSGATGTGTVKIKMSAKGPDGKSKSVAQDVPATPDNIRTALRQEQKRRSPDAGLLAKLGSMLRGATGTVAAPVTGAAPGTYKVREAVTLDAPNAPEGRDERQQGERKGHVPTSPGPALVNGRPMSGAIPQDSDRVTAKGGPRNAIGWGGPLGRVKPDAIAITGDRASCGGKKCVIKGCVGIVGGERFGFIECHVYRTMSKSQQRKYWQHVANNGKRAKQAKTNARRVVDMPHRQFPVSRSAMGGAAIRQV